MHFKTSKRVYVTLLNYDKNNLVLVILNAGNEKLCCANQSDVLCLFVDVSVNNIHYSAQIQTFVTCIGGAGSKNLET